MKNRIGLLVLFAAYLAVPPTHAARADPTSELFWTFTGSGNPDLTYFFQSRNIGLITSSNLAEAPLPVTFTGRILNNGSGPLGCFDGGIVEDAFFTCWEPSRTTMLRADCPLAEGVWRGFAQLTILPTQTFTGISPGSVIANCPTVCTDIPSLQSLTAETGSMRGKTEPSPVSPSFRAGMVAGIDLETGYQIDRALARAVPHTPLHRVTKIDDTTYVLDEFAVVDLTPGGETRVERASSPRTAQDAAEWGRSLRALRTDTAGRASEIGSGRYLLIQGMEHLTGERRPMVKFRPPTDLSLPENGKVVVRARFSAEGEVETLDVLEGDMTTARALTEALELVFIDGSEHRLVVYAVFQGGDRPELTAAIPTFIQCCCDGFLCPG